MKKKQAFCKHHLLPIVPPRQFCTKCEEQSNRVMDQLNNFFSGITIEFGKDGEPKVTRNK